jgi:hypothetical protein
VRSDQIHQEFLPNSQTTRIVGSFAASDHVLSVHSEHIDGSQKSGCVCEANAGGLRRFEGTACSLARRIARHDHSGTPVFSRIKQEGGRGVESFESVSGGDCSILLTAKKDPGDLPGRMIEPWPVLSDQR